MSFIQSYTYNPATEKVVPKSAIVIRDWTPGVGDHRDSLLELLRANYWSHLANEIERETAEPRIPEPEWSGVVEASTSQNSDRLRWQRDSGTHKAHWVCEDINEYDRTWDDLIDPTLIRGGFSLSTS